MLICEIGNVHGGNLDYAKTHIRAAHESGADICKMQAFLADDISGGSMPKRFYEQCEFTIRQHIELIYYARSIGTDLFYSIFSPTFWTLQFHQNYFKIAGSQIKNNYFALELFDSPNVIFSVPQAAVLKRVPKVERAFPLYVGEYLKEPQLHYIETLEKHFNKPVGYSDHTEGVDNCLRAYETYGCDIIEKHFTLEKNVGFYGQIFRDTVHGATPSEFETLAKRVKGKH